MKRRPGAGRPALEEQPVVFQFKLRCQPGQDDDLINWLRAVSAGRRSAAIKAALRAGGVSTMDISGLPDDDEELDAALDGLIF